MPTIDFSKVGSPRDFSPLPEGKYLCRLAKVEETTTQSGSPMWKLLFVVARGRHEGRFIRDRVAFTAAALKRVKALGHALGLDVKGKVTLTPKLVTGRTCYVRVRLGQYENAAGEMVSCNEVLFSGFEPAPRDADADDDAGEDGDEGDDEAPF